MTTLNTSPFVSINHNEQTLHNMGAMLWSMLRLWMWFSSWGSANGELSESDTPQRTPQPPVAGRENSYAPG